MLKRTLLAAILCLGTLFVIENSHAQDPRHSYPLIGWQTFTGAIADYYARFDLIVSRHTDSEIVHEIKAINPDARCVSTHDWNSARDIQDIMPEEWWLKSSNGDYFYSYGNLKMANMSDLCPRPTTGQFAGMRYCDYVPIFMTSRVDLSVWDGVGTQGAWGRDGLDWKYGKDQWADVDIDGNGVNDIDEHDEEWFLSHWQAGVDHIMTESRRILGPDKLLIINSGTIHTWGWDIANGVIDEKLTSYSNDRFRLDYYNDMKAAAPEPFVSVADGRPFDQNPNVPAESKNDFLGMRFGLVTSMFNDIYYSFQNLEASEHYWSHWYDEFEVDLGQPTGPPHEIRTGLWVRFFEKGAAIASTDGSSKTAMDADLRGFSEYGGPYYRFHGGQNPEFNNGQPFSSVNLEGIIVTQQPRRIFGDGILLTKEPTHIISDIVIDDNDAGTSPASSKAELNGFEIQTNCRNGRDFYTIRCSSWLDAYAYAYASPGNNTATFRPTIGVPGIYEVFEWHGQMDNTGMASNVEYVIKHSNGEVSRTVDQSSNQGQWNSLGSFFFTRGKNNYVQISANGANGMVMADAVKLVFRDVDPNADTTPPDTPSNVKVTQ